MTINNGMMSCVAKVSKQLKQMGFDAVLAIETMKGAEDTVIIRIAKKENRIILTNDKDFGWLAPLYKPPGLILLRLKEETVEAKSKTIVNHFKTQ